MQTQSPIEREALSHDQESGTRTALSSSAAKPPRLHTWLDVAGTEGSQSLLACVTEQTDANRFGYLGVVCLFVCLLRNRVLRIEQVEDTHRSQKRNERLREKERRWCQVPQRKGMTSFLWIWQ